MTSHAPVLDLCHAAELAARAFVPARPGQRAVGLEVEWIVVDPSRPSRPVAADEVLAACAGPLPRGGTVGVEPGGQLELTTARHAHVTGALDAADAEETVLRRRAGAAGLLLVATGTDPWRPPRRHIGGIRYRGMDAAFARHGPAGQAMMCSTAALQVNVDFGREPLDTWRRAGALAPVLAAAFANSPDPADPSIVSARSAVWAGVDPTRTRPVPTGSVADWVAYALDARVLYLRDGDGLATPPADFTLRSWITGGHRLGWPTAAEVVEHLTTLFPPVRPRGWIECRFFDALPAAERRVAVLVLTALLDEATDARVVAEACGGSDRLWPVVRRGTAHHGLALAADRCAALAAGTLGAGVGTPVGTAAVAAWLAARRGSGWVPRPTPAPTLIDQESA